MKKILKYSFQGYYKENGCKTAEISSQSTN